MKVNTAFMIALAACVALPGFVRAQVARDTLLEKPLPRVVEWVDNRHCVLLQPGNKPGQSATYLLDARNGKKEPYAFDRKAMMRPRGRCVRRTATFTSWTAARNVALPVRPT